MKLSEFKTRIKIAVPNLSAVDDNAVTALLNQGCDQANLYCKAYKGYTDFNITANTMLYTISSIAPTFLAMDNKPLYFKDSDSNWQRLWPKTKAWIQQKYSDFLNVASVAVPTWYWQENNELGFYPPPSTTLANGGRIYHLKKRTDMSSDDHYPFTGTDTEIAAFLPMDDAIIAYCKWKLSPSVGAVTDQDLREREFLSECARASKQMRRRPDLYIDSTFSMST